MIGRELLADLRQLARCAKRLPPPDRRNPEAFHLARDALGHEIERLAGELERLLQAHELA